MPGRRFQAGGEQSFNFSFPPDSVPLHIIDDDPPPPYMHRSSSRVSPCPHDHEDVHTAPLAPHPYSGTCFCPACTEIEAKNWANIKRMFSGPYTPRKLFRIAKFLFISLFIAVFALRMISHFRPVVLVKTLGHDIYSAAGDSFFILFVYPVTISHRLPSWMCKQTIALWDDLRLAQSFIPTFGRLVLRFVGIFLFFFLIAPYLIRNLVLRPLQWITTTKKSEVSVRPRGTAGIYDIPDRMLERMIRDAREARALFNEIPPTPIADDANRGGNNNRRNRRRRC